MRFTSKAPCIDVIPKQHSLKQLPLLNQFFDIEPAAELIRSTERTQFLVRTLGTITSALQPIGFSQFFNQSVIRMGNRRARLQPQVTAKMDEALSSKFSPDVVANLKAEIAKNAASTTKEAKQASGTKSVISVCLFRLAKLTAVDGATFFDLISINSSSESWTAATHNAKITEHNQHIGKLQNHEAHSRSVLNEMVTPAQ